LVPALETPIITRTYYDSTQIDGAPRLYGKQHVAQYLHMDMDNNSKQTMVHVNGV